MTKDKPTVQALAQRLGCETADLPWQTSGRGEGMFQVAIVRPGDDEVWVLVRLKGGADVQVYSEYERECFIDGTRRGEFDDLL